MQLFFSSFFQSSFSEKKFIPSHLRFFIKSLIVFIFWKYFLISSWFNATVTAYWKHLLLFYWLDLLLDFCLLSNKENYTPQYTTISHKKKIHIKKPPSGPSFPKVAGLGSANLIKRRLWHRCFPVNFGKFIRTPFYRTPLADCFCFSWIELQMLLKCCLMHISIIIVRHFIIYYICVQFYT